MTPNIPLSLRLRKKAEKDVAYAQDLIVGELYNFFPNAIIHGGTAIWRCYNGNRFSEDVDVYIERDLNKIEEFFRSLENIGFKIIKKRVKDNSIYSDLDLNGIPARFEATFQNKSPFLRRYETCESFFINVNTLSPEDLVIEKVETFLKRLKIRDLYDINFLLNYVEDITAVSEHLKKLIANYKKPLDEKNLVAIIIIGAVPTSEQIITEIRRWVK